jgi:hypothetical protein
VSCHTELAEFLLKLDMLKLDKYRRGTFIQTRLRGTLLSFGQRQSVRNFTKTVSDLPQNILSYVSKKHKLIAAIFFERTWTMTCNIALFKEFIFMN